MPPVSSLSRLTPEDNEKGFTSLDLNPWSLSGKFIKGAFSSVDDIIRGLGRMGGAVVSDLALEPLRSLIPGGDPGAFGPEGVDSSVGEDILKPIGLSLANTLDTVADLTYVGNAVFKGGEEANAEALERLVQATDDPFMFTLEHVGNVALGGAAVSKLAGAGAKTAGAAGHAQTAARMGRVADVAGDVVAHPYRAAGRALKESRPAQLIRNPLPREEALARFRSLYGQEEGAVNFRPEDPRRRWNEVQDQLISANRLAGSSESSLASQGTRQVEKLAIERMHLERELKAQGYDLPENNTRFTLEDADPKDLVAEKDFEFDPTSADDFARRVVRSTEVTLRSDYFDIEPGTVQIHKHEYGEGWDVFKTNEAGEVIGSMQVYPDDIHVGVLPEYQGQGVMSQIRDAAIEANLPLEEAFRAGHISMSQFGAKFAESSRQKLVEQGRVFDNTRSRKLAEPPRENPDAIPEQVVEPAPSLEETFRGVDDVAREFQTHTSPQGQRFLDTLMDALRSEEGSLNIFSKKQEGTVGPIDLLANELGLIKESDLVQQHLGKAARTARGIREDLRRAAVYGQGEIAKRAGAMVGREVGDINLRRQYDPSRTERLFLNDIKNLGKRPDAPRWASLSARLEPFLDRIDVGSVPSRVKEVATGERAVGQTLGPDELVTLVQEVMDEAKKIADEGEMPFAEAMGQILPQVDPVSVHLMGLNALESLHGLPENSLTSALTDYMELDKFADVNRRVQQQLVQGGRQIDSALGTRFRIPDEELGVNLSELPESHQDMFYDAARSWREYMGAEREPALLSQGLIPKQGTRAGLLPDEPSVFPESLDELNVPEELQKNIDRLTKDKEAQVKRVDKLRDHIDNLTDQKAIRRNYEKLGEEKLKLAHVSSKLQEAEAAALLDPKVAPAAARNLLVYTNQVAPAQKAALKTMIDEGVGDAQVIQGLIDEIDAMPTTLEQLNAAETYVTYLRNVKGIREGELGPGFRKGVDTRKPKGMKTRSTATDIEFSRDFRARAYYGDAEFQAYFMAQQADVMVRTHNLVKSGQARLKELGYTADDISSMTKGQIQQALESDYLVYQPDQMFGISRKPTELPADPLKATWIQPFIARQLENAVRSPNLFEKAVMQGIWDPATQAWKVSALPLRLAWQVNNTAGNALLTMLAGKVSPFDYPSLLKASWSAVKNYNRGFTNRLRVPISKAYKVDLQKQLANLDPTSSQAAHLTRQLEQGYIDLPNEVLQEVVSSGLTRGDFAWLNNSQFLRDIGAQSGRNILQQLDITSGGTSKLPDTMFGRARGRVRNLKQTGREVVDLAYHINEVVDNLHRTIVYMDQMGKGATHTQAMAQVLKTLGDYTKLTGFEKRFVKRVYPFYPWMRHVTEVVASSLSPTNITRTTIFAHLTQIWGQPNEWEELLPDWAGGHIYMGEDENGLPKFASSRGLNPFLDVFDPLAQPHGRGLLRPIHPVLGAGAEQISGISNLTGRPFSSPVEPASGLPPRPSVGEQFIKAVPQLRAGRDVLRDIKGEPLTRYGTGEPAFFPGAETGKSSLQSVAQLFGYNVKPLNVEQINQQEIVRKYREDVARAQQEAKVRANQ